MLLLQSVVSFVTIDGVKTVHYLGIEKSYDSFLHFSGIYIQLSAAVHALKNLWGDCELHVNACNITILLLNIVK
jgi:hypothetical protein